jgi:hypothetical protein
MRQKTSIIILFVLLTCVTAFGQTSYKGLTPGKSTKINVQRVLGLPVNKVNETLIEYRPQPLTSKIYVQYGQDSVVEKIEARCLLPNSTCKDFARSLGLRLPENPETVKGPADGKGKYVSYYGPPLYVATMQDDESKEGGDQVVPDRIVFYSRELYEATVARVKEANVAAIAKAEEDRKKRERDGIAPAIIRGIEDERTTSSAARPATPPGQSSFQGLTPGVSTRSNVTKALGQPVSEVSPTLSEYAPPQGIAKVYVQYRKESQVVERIEVLLLKPILRSALLRQFNLPDQAVVQKTDKQRRLLEYFGGPAFLVLTYASTDASSGVTRIGYYSRELFESAVAKVPRSPQIQDGSTSADSSDDLIKSLNLRLPKNED